MADYRVQFDRVGRTANPDPMVFESVTDPDELAALIVESVKPMLLSRNIEAVVDLDEMRGSVFAGFQAVGSCTIEELG